MKTYMAILLLFACVAAQAQCIYKTSFGNERETFEVEITSSDLASTPDWLSSDENPPLSPKKAMQVARATLIQFMPETIRWELFDIKLHPTDSQDKWFYEVEYKEPPRDPSISQPLRVISTFVLMNGKSATIYRKRNE